MRYADPGRCPDCRTTFEHGTTTCPHCALPLDNPVAEELNGVLLRADVLISRLRNIRDQEARLEAAPTAAGPVGPAAGPAGPAAGPAPQSSGVAEPSPYVPGPRTELPDLDLDDVPVANSGSLTVPLILVGVGALCLMVAGTIFLAVAWTAMGVGGRTAMLGAFTALMVVGGWVLLQGELRAGVEGVWTLALGLVVVDLVGLRAAGWLELEPSRGFLVVAGVLLALGGVALGVVGHRSDKVPDLVGPQMSAVAGLTIALLGLTRVVGLDWFPLVCCLIALGVVMAAFVVGLRVLGWGGFVPATAFWLLLVTRGLLHPARTVAELFVGDTLIMLLGAAGVMLLVALLRMMPRVPAVILAGVAAALTAYAFSQPVLDEGPAALTALAVVMTTIGAAALWRLPEPWHWSMLALTPYAVGLVVSLGFLVASSAMRLAGLPWRHTAGSTLSHPEPMLAGWLALPAMLGVALGWLAFFQRAHSESFARARALVAWTLSGGAVIGLAMTAACYDTPRWIAPLLLLALTAALVWRATHTRLAVAAGIGLLALLAALPSEGLTVVAALGLTAVATVVDRTHEGTIRQVAACCSVVTLALGLWALVVVTGAEAQYAGLVVVVVLGLVTVGRRLPLAWAAAAVGAGISIWLGFVDTTWLAVQLTVATVLAAATGVRHRSRVALGVSGVVGVGALVAAWTAGDAATLVVALLLTGLAIAADSTQTGLRRQVALAYWICMLAVALWQLGEILGLSPHPDALLVVLVLGVVALVRRTPAAESTAALAAVTVITLSSVFGIVSLGWLAVLMLVVAVLCIATIARHDARQAGGRLTVAGLVGLGALGAAWQDSVLALVVAAVLTGAAALVDFWSRDERTQKVTGPYAIVTLTVGLWMLTRLVGFDRPYAAVLSLLVLGAVVTSRLLVPAEITAAVLGAASVLYGSVGRHGVVDPGWAAGLLAIVAALCAAHALIHRPRRAVGWAALVVATAALWVWLGSTGVHVPEWYTLPPAVALLVYGVVRLRTDPLPSSASVLGPGVALALLPSLPFAFEEPLSLRTLVLGLAAAAFAVAGALLRWAAPLVGGAVVVVLVVLRELPAPNLEEQWWVIGVVGLVLLVVGVAREARAHAVRRTTSFFRRLR